MKSREQIPNMIFISIFVLFSSANIWRFLNQETFTEEAKLHKMRSFIRNLKTCRNLAFRTVLVINYWCFFYKYFNPCGENEWEILLEQHCLKHLAQYNKRIHKTIQKMCSVWRVVQHQNTDLLIIHWDDTVKKAVQFPKIFPKMNNTDMS